MKNIPSLAASHRAIRYPELDALRGIAVLAMALYHLCFDLDYFYGYDLRFGAAGWKFAAQSIATLFLILVGVNFVLSWSRTPVHKRMQKTLKRAGVLLLCASIISIATWFVAPDAFVKFGILHLIGVSALIQPLFVRFHAWNVLIGTAIFSVGQWLLSLTTSSAFLFPLGIKYPAFASLDYYPLLPWFGVVLIGMGMASIFYLPQRHSSLAWLSFMRYPRWLLWSGRQALFLYLLHQPVILLTLFLLLRLSNSVG